MANPIQSYLAGYAEPEASQAGSVVHRYDQCLIIPAYDEPLNFLSTVTRSSTNTLFIVVVNVPDHADAASVQRTRSLLAGLQSSNREDVLVIDRVSNPIPYRQGVGLARKIGTDVALALFAQGKLASPWLHQTDADAVLPDDYFSAKLPAGGALVYAHTHHSDDPQLQQAADLYDLHMRYYVAALQYVGSRYAYPTLGSTIAVHARDYAAVRGFPKRNAAEDFYLLNKVAKVGGVSTSNVTIRLAARLSHRVPFGTGPALQKVYDSLTLHPSGSDYLSYSWSSFGLLQTALAELDRFSNGSLVLSAEVKALLDALGFAKVVHQIKHQYSPGERRRVALHDWFDGFKTLRFVHEARRFHVDEPLLHTLPKLPSAVRNTMQIPLSV